MLDKKRNKSKYNLPLTRRRMLAGLGALALTGAPALARLDRRVRVIVPTSSGSATDLVARMLQPGLSKVLGVPVIVDNIAGASGLIGLQAVRRSPAEISLVAITNSLTIVPSTMKTFPFDMQKDFTPVAMLVTIPMAMGASPRLKAANAKELIDQLKNTPGKINFGSSGIGSISHLASEMFLDRAGALKAVHVPFQGPGPMTVGLLGDQVDFASQGLPVFQSLFKNGLLVPMGMLSSKRALAAPDVPTMAEQGLSDLDVDAWLALLGPKDLEPSVVSELGQGVAQALGEQEVKEQLLLQGAEVMLAGPEDLQKTIAKDIERFAAVVQKIGLAPH